MPKAAITAVIGLAASAASEDASPPVALSKAPIAVLAAPLSLDVSESPSTVPSAASPVASSASADPAAACSRPLSSLSVMEIFAVSCAYSSLVTVPFSSPSAAPSALCFISSSFSCVSSIWCARSCCFCATSSVLPGSSLSAASIDFRAVSVFLRLPSSSSILFWRSSVPFAMSCMALAVSSDSCFMAFRLFSVLASSAVSFAYCSCVTVPFLRPSAASSATCFMILSLLSVCSICFVNRLCFCVRSSTFFGSSLSALFISVSADFVVPRLLSTSLSDLVRPLLSPSISIVIPTIFPAMSASCLSENVVHVFLCCHLVILGPIVTRFRHHVVDLAELQIEQVGEPDTHRKSTEHENSLGIALAVRRPYTFFSLL